MKAAFLEQPERLCHQMKRVLPDFLSAKAPRALLPRPRWKELWLCEPASMAALEQQLARLVEQALWAMAADPAPATPAVEALSRPTAVELEPWMVEHDDEVAKAREATKMKKKKRRQKQQLTLLEPIEDDAQAAADEGEEVEAMA